MRNPEVLSREGISFGRLGLSVDLWQKRRIHFARGRYETRRFFTEGSSGQTGRIRRASQESVAGDAGRAVAPRLAQLLAVSGPDGLLFGYFETPDSFRAALDGMSGEEINARWQAFMAPYFEALDGARPDESMIELREIFHLD